MGKLALYLPDGTVQDIALDKERIVIGRRADNDVCLPFPAVSGEHASVVTILADSFLEDLGSTNGTLVNGKAIVKHFLRDQDVIDIGRQRLIYLADDEDSAEPLTPEQLVRGLRELDEQVARVRAARVPPVPDALHAPPANESPVPTPVAASGASDSPQPHADMAPGEASVSIAVARRRAREATAPSRPDSPALRPEADAASQLDSKPRVARRSEASVQAGEPIRRDSAQLGGRTRDAAASSRAPQPGDAGFGERSRELAQLVEARRHWMPKVERAKDPLDESGDDGALRRRSAIVPPSQAVSSGREVRLRVTAGPSTGRELVLDKDVTTFGRVGLQVAQIRRARDGWELVAIEGEDAPMLNGMPVRGAAQSVKPGDTIIVAGQTLTLVTA